MADSEQGTTASSYKGHIFRIGAPRGDGKPIQVWTVDGVRACEERFSSIPAAMRWVDGRVSVNPDAGDITGHPVLIRKDGKVEIGDAVFTVNNIEILTVMNNHIGNEQVVDLQLTLTRPIRKD